MKANAESTLVFVVLVSFVLTPINMFVVQGGSLTREEAIEISRNALIVQEALSKNKGTMLIEADYWSIDYISVEREKGPGDIMEKLPDDHGVWRVRWINDAPGYHILHFIDELSGQVLYEMWFIAG